MLKKNNEKRIQKIFKLIKTNSEIAKLFNI